MCDDMNKPTPLDRLKVAFSMIALMCALGSVIVDQYTLAITMPLFLMSAILLISAVRGDFDE